MAQAMIGSKRGSPGFFALYYLGHYYGIITFAEVLKHQAQGFIITVDFDQHEAEMY